MAMTREDRRARAKAAEDRIASIKGVGSVYGLLKGMSVTLRTMLRPAITAQYPHVKPDLPPRTRGVIAFQPENCTVCMLCARECPDWCIYIDSHKDVVPPKTPGARARTRNVLDRFAIDFSLCMYCGICVEVCPFDALFWSPHFEYSSGNIDDLVHEMETLKGWMGLVPPPPALEEGADAPLEIGKEPKVYGAEPAPAAPPPPVAETPAAQVPPAAAADKPATPAEEHAPPEIDEAVFAEQIAAGKSEREARAMAKKAWVLARKKAVAALPAQETAAAVPAEPAAPAAEEHAPPQIDEEVYAEQIAAGKSEREARAMAKKAWVLKRKRGEA